MGSSGRLSGAAFLSGPATFNFHWRGGPFFFSAKSVETLQKTAIYRCFCAAKTGIIELFL
jgi:hypothetical protein